MLKIFADDLKAHREENGISLRDVAAKTRLNMTVLENLENGDYNFQPQAYIRAFMKQYISAIGLDLDEVLFDYDLARSGKYKSKRENVTPKVEDTIEEKINSLDEPKKEGTKQSITEKIKKAIDVPKILSEDKKKSLPEETNAKKTTDIFSLPKGNDTSENSDTKPKNKFLINTSDPKSNKTSVPVNPVNSRDSFAFLNTPVFKNIFLILIGALVIGGLYSLINIIFFEGSKNNPVVERQNFDDVVNEQERKILGKRTPEEIQDSIRKAEEEYAALKDSINLKITTTAAGILYLVKDSVNYNKPEKIEFDKGETGTFKANRSFHISSANTETFKAFINDKPLKFDNKSVSKVKITGTGIIK
ncbi:MAG TPA: helix-turn-helix transcriptional regulator [Ignavibacteria bacterium]|nr:helix-turn-helix transcriptional regulator [Ignavibacteria bacterium]